MGNRIKASTARRDVLQSERRRAREVRELLRARAMVVGSFVELERKCGKATCRCARGEKHSGNFLSRKSEGRTQLLYVPQREAAEIALKAERYRRFRQARASLMKLGLETAQAADRLQAALTERYPKEARRRRKRR